MVWGIWNNIIGQQAVVLEVAKTAIGMPATSKEELAATSLQKFIRGFNARKPLLPNDFYPRYKKECILTLGPDKDSIPQANTGKTKVYLPKNMPEVVLKESGRKDAVQRFHQMQKVRNILEAQGSARLVIPKASLCQHFLIEQRLPINADNYHNMGLYLSNLQLFDDAVREMTRLFSRICIGDLFNQPYQKHPLSYIDGMNDMIRYDNMPLYIEEEKGRNVGKIGLIDLEQIKEQNSLSAVHQVPIIVYSPIKTLAIIFPWHGDIIKEEAAKLKMDFNEDDFNMAIEKGKKYFQLGYINHANWLKAKGITSKSAINSIQITPERVQEINQVVVKEWLKINMGVNEYVVRVGGFLGYTPPKNFLKDSPEQAVKELSSEVVSLILANLNSILKEKLNLQPNFDLSEGQLISLRSQVIGTEKILKGVEEVVEKSDKITKENLNFGDTHDMAQQLAYTVIKELERGGEIFHYDDNIFKGSHKQCWIRY